MSFRNLRKFFRGKREKWEAILLVSLSLVGIVLAFLGFQEARGECHTFGNSLYETFRMFVLGVDAKTSGGVCLLRWARWLIFGVFVWATVKIFLRILAPRFLTLSKIRLCYRDHIVICGLDKLTVGLIERFGDEKIVVLAREANIFAGSAKRGNVTILIGDCCTDEAMWRRAKIKRAAKLYAIDDSDETNVKIAQSAFSYLKGTGRKDALKCFVLIRDRRLKSILEESALFNSKKDPAVLALFDGVVFNIDTIGMEYGISMNIEKILPPDPSGAVPGILLVGLTEKAQAVLLALAHCLTMDRKSFRFTVVEKDSGRIDAFRAGHPWLADFAEVDYVREVEDPAQYDSILVCLDNRIAAIEKAFELRCLSGANRPGIVIFCDDPDIFVEVLGQPGERNIFIVDLLEQVADYVFDIEGRTGREIERRAKKTHGFWDARFGMDLKWDELSGHFKQSNRDQVLDGYLKAYLAQGEKHDPEKRRPVEFSARDKETLAIMEHRRWMIEKYENGWVCGDRDNEFKRHHCLVDWSALPEDERSKDRMAVDLLEDFLNEPQQ